MLLKCRSSTQRSSTSTDLTMQQASLDKKTLFFVRSIERRYLEEE